MKYEIKTESDEFSPIQLNLTINSQAELNFFTALFNYAPMVDIMPFSIAASEIRESLQKNGGDSNADVLHSMIYSHPSVRNHR